jgi:TolA-binding protein
MMKKAILPVAAVIALSGCLKTRNDVKDGEQRQVMQQQTTSLQREAADTTNRVGDLQEQIRYLTGRVDVMENKQATAGSSADAALRASQQQNQDLNQKVAIMQEALTKMEAQVFQLNADIQALKAEKAAAAAQAALAAKKDPYESGQEFFAQKDWKKAILNYQKYRDQAPKGKNYAEATYRIGVSFQELGMKDEAKTFYDEVVNKFPKTDQARRAKTRLKSLKK